MSLFKPNTDQEKEAKPTTKPSVLVEQTTGVEHHLWTGQKINLHNVLAQYLMATGPSELFLCSWSISVPAIKNIIALKESGLILSITAVVDLRTKKDHPEAFAMCQELFDKLGIYPCHAKVIVAINDISSFSIFGSANLTKNTKEERISISTSHSVSCMDRAYIVDMYNKSQIIC
jgi:hypothetical protein